MIKLEILFIKHEYERVEHILSIKETETLFRSFENMALWKPLIQRGRVKMASRDMAQSRLQFIIGQMQETENVTDELKSHDQMAWVRAMNSIYNRAEEIVIHELVL